MSEAKQGDTVKVHYTGKLEDGSVFDTSKDREPLEFTIGSGSIIPGFERAVVGMGVDDTRTVQIGADDAYGPRKDDLIISVPKTEFPDEIDPKVGLQLQLGQPDGSNIPVVISEVTDTNVSLDANHPLAGNDLSFEITLVENNPA